ncbi:exported hypothetical protein [Hyella patelloides LEGE 07179]|uniref:PEP-CTERM protein-sorting domain-containing protein n=1 Tax=Hyella patelloides LEGE 07179 TaxID=945734 RepID=A0A563VST7_9CYAN|nr:hypothetical protein [Hyella patelloides]VEP14442.1 exported hypothetical protein [Hyella patelloides LEGE 07179]
MGLRTYISLGVASVATLSGAGAAQAAALQGRVGINPPSPTPGGEQTGVVFTGTGITVGDVDPNAPDPTRPLTDLDFVPPEGGGTGPVVELNANPFNGSNDFAAFVGQTGDIRDLPFADTVDLINNPIPDFIVLDNAFSVTLTSLQFPEYTFDGTGTTVSLGVTGDFINLSDGSNDVSFGTGTFSVDFAGLSIAETRALFDEPGETPDQFNPGTWSSNWVVEGEEHENIPEASNLLGLLAVGLGGAFVLARKKK